jgi:delta(3,5)-delta(2,4)-dienoyl-CoA isomerase
MRQVFTALSEDPYVREIVLSGAGEKAFTTVLDVKPASEGRILSGDSNLDHARKATHLRRRISEFQDCISVVERCEKPVIVAMHGFCLGLAKEVDISLAADIGNPNRLPKVVGNLSWVKEVSMSACVFGAKGALRVGFVNSLHEDRAATIGPAMELASLIAQKSPVAVHGTKEILNWSLDHSGEMACVIPVCGIAGHCRQSTFLWRCDLEPKTYAHV